MADNVRISFDARQLKRAVRAKLNEKVVPLTKHLQLRNDIARLYGDILTPYVPRSADSPEELGTYTSKRGKVVKERWHKKSRSNQHHLQSFVVGDGRVTWYRKNEAGEEIGRFLFNGGNGTWHKRANGGNDYGAHNPRTHWTDAMNHAGNWSTFVSDAAEIIKDYMKGL